jgi:glycosyltransferase involved in cell wall biosynthesis
MISICIPIYNINCNQLVDDLLKQISLVNVPIEIICIDDESDESYRVQNHNLVNKCTYLLLEKNIGRAKIRNIFLQHAQYDWLLFLDSDAIVSNPFFLQNYIQAIFLNSALVYCGGTHFLPPNTLTCKNNLAYAYLNNDEKKRSIKLLEYKAFTTNNILVNRIVSKKVPFNESLTRYGHEDTLFGYELKLNKIAVKGIRNKVSCVADDDNKAFLVKTESAIENLIFITAKLNGDKGFISDVTLLKYYYKFKFFVYITQYFHAPILHYLYKKFCSGWYHSIAFNIYKIVLLHKKTVAIKK